MKIKRLFNLKTMSQDLCKKEISKTEFIVYVIVSIVLFGASLLLIRPDVYISMYVFYANLTSMTIFTLTWFSLAYIVNKKGDGKDFWYRFIGLNITIFIIVSIISFVIGIFSAIFINPIPVNSNEFPKQGWVDFYIVNIISILYIYLTCKYMYFISHECK